VDLVGAWDVVDVDGASLEFAADGTVSGSTGINRVHGSYTVVAGELRLGPLVTTRMAGPPQAMAAENRLLRLLGGPLSVRPDGRALELVGETDSVRLEPGQPTTVV
jgi:heat shock protein HslJ